MGTSWAWANTFRPSLVQGHLPADVQGAAETRFAAVWSAVGSGSATPLWLGTVNSMCRARYRFVWILRFEGTGLVWSFCHCGVLPLISLALHGHGRTRFAPPWCRRTCLPMIKERRNVSADVHGWPLKSALAHLIGTSWAWANAFRPSLVQTHLPADVQEAAETRFAAVWSAVGSGSATPLWLGTVNSGCRSRYRFVWILRFEETGLVRSFGHCEWLAVIAKAVSALVPRSATALQRKTCRPGVGGRLME